MRSVMWPVEILAFAFSEAAFDLFLEVEEGRRMVKTCPSFSESEVVQVTNIDVEKKATWLKCGVPPTKDQNNNGRLHKTHTTTSHLPNLETPPHRQHSILSSDLSSTLLSFPALHQTFSCSSQSARSRSTCHG